MSNISREEVRHIFQVMCESRYFQEKMKENDIGGYYDIGEEAITTGALEALEKGDKVSTYFRGEGVTLRTKSGMSLKELMAWWMGKKSDGHAVTNVIPTLWTDVEHGVIGTTSSCLGGDMDVSCGVALAQKMQKTGNVVMFVMGDGAAGKGNFHEMMNFAALQKLPLIVLIRANGWAMSTPTQQSIAADHAADMAASYKVPAVITDGNDAVKVYDEVKKAIEWTRSGKGPYVVEAATYRMVGHSSRDEDDYRSADVMEEWKKKDPIIRMRSYMEQYGFSAAEVEKLEADIRQEVEDAYENAKNLPDQDIEEVIKLHESVVNQMWGRQQVCGN